MEKEIWEDIHIDELKGLYQVSNYGNVKSFKWGRHNVEHILKSCPSTKGYPQVGVSTKKNGIKFKKTIAVHILVANVFLKKITSKTQVNHKDGDKTNNNVLNLEWCTNGENVQHSYDKLGRSKIRPKWRKSTYTKLCKKVSQYDMEGNLINEFSSTRDVFRKLGFDTSLISKCCRGIIKKGYGYTWKYV